eukprot:1147670-Pelagomonas_calceolata.AAC.2
MGIRRVLAVPRILICFIEDKGTRETYLPVPLGLHLSIVECNGAGITNTIGRAELNWLLLLLHSLTNAHTLPLTASAHFTNSKTLKKILYPEKHRHHVQGDVLKTISNLARTFQGHIFFNKVKSHAG